MATHASELASLDAALRAAGECLEHARAQAAQKADKAAATELINRLVQFVATAKARWRSR